MFVTVCTKGRRSWLACQEAHAGLLQSWAKADAWMVGRYVLMPDHLHLFAAPLSDRAELDAWVRYWKSLFTRAHMRADWRWQAGHWDTTIRDPDTYERKWEYVRANPVRKGLVDDPDLWPYQDEPNALVTGAFGHTHPRG